MVFYSDIGMQIFTKAENLHKLHCDTAPLKFLIKQKHLKILNIQFDLRKSSIFSDDFTSHVKFRLEKLTVGDSGIRDDDVDIEGKEQVLVKFINLHQHHLNDLHIWAKVDSRSLKEILKNHKNLQRLNLSLQEDGFEVDPELFSQLKASRLGVMDLELRLFSSITEKWNVQLLEKFLECFPNVCNLKLDFGMINYEEHNLKVRNSC